MSEDLFAKTNTTQADVDPNKNYVEELVGEGKKFKTTEDLARGKAESDRFIERLLQEKEAMRQDLATRQRLEDLITKLGTQSTTQRQSTSNEDNQDSRERDGVTIPPVKQADINPSQARDMVESIVIARENFTRAQQGIKQIFGEDYQTQLDSETKKLGLDATFVNNLAKANPEAFLRLFQGSAPVKDNSFTPPGSSVNSTSMSSMNNNSERTSKYYKNLKRTDPKTYSSSRIQLQEHNDAIRLGAAFFDA